MKQFFYLAFFLILLPAFAQACPSNSYLADTSDDGTQTTEYCKCLPGYTPVGENCISSNGHVKDPKKKMAVVDPRNFAMLGEAELIQTRLDALAKQKPFLLTERDKLIGIKDGNMRLVSENAAATKDIILDTESQLLDVIGGLLAVAELPPEVAHKASFALANAQAFNTGRTIVSTKERERAQDLLVDEVGHIKNIGMANKWADKAFGESLNKGMDAYLKIQKILNRHFDPMKPDTTEKIDWREDLEDTYGALSEIAGILVPAAGGGMKVAGGIALTAKGEYARRRLDNDRAEIEEALNNNLKALDYYNQRIEQVEKDEEFYRERMNHIPEAQKKAVSKQ